MRKQAPVAAWDPKLVGWLERWAWHCRGNLSVGDAAAGTGMVAQLLAAYGTLQNQGEA